MESTVQVLLWTVLKWQEAVDNINNINNIIQKQLANFAEQHSCLVISAMK